MNKFGSAGVSGVEHNTTADSPNIIGGHPASVAGASRREDTKNGR